MSQRGHLSLPVLQEGNSPEGHEDTEEDGARVVKQVAQLPHTHTHTEGYSTYLLKTNLNFLV